jgi:hypothetical protein
MFNPFGAVAGAGCIIPWAMPTVIQIKLFQSFRIGKYEFTIKNQKSDEVANLG